MDQKSVTTKWALFVWRGPGTKLVSFPIISENVTELLQLRSLLYFTSPPKIIVRHKAADAITPEMALFYSSWNGAWHAACTCLYLWIPWAKWYLSTVNSRYL